MPYGSREYLLLPPHVPLDQATPDLILARLHGHRQVIFGATNPAACPPLLERALKDAASQGEQPQALATLHGLCAWVHDCLEDKARSAVLATLDETSKQACIAIATGVPRPGHSVVGAGTYRDAEAGWKALAQEFCQAAPSAECRLYLQAGKDLSVPQATLVGIEHLADTQPEYLQSAGGAMARYFFG